MKPFKLVAMAGLVGASGLPAAVAQAAQPHVCLIQPSRIAEVGSSVTGVIETLRVERGDYVRKGQVIAVLRNDVERAALNVAKSRAQAEADVAAAAAALDFARQNTQRTEDLFKRKFISEQALDKTRTEERVAVQKLAQAREQRRIWEREMGLAQSQLAQRTLVSPIGGIVAERYVSSGERVEDRSVARIVSIHPLHVEALVPASSFGKIRPGMEATVTPELPDAAPLVARVTLVDKLIDGASNTFRVRLELPNPDHALPAGPRCKVAFGDQVVAPAKSAADLKPMPAVPRTAAPAARPPVASTPAAPARRDVETDVLAAAESWRRAWEAKDFGAYLAAYAADFRGDAASRAAWVKHREARILKPGRIRVQLSEPRVEPLGEREARIQFSQHYASETFRNTARKSLLMVLEQGRWIIKEERVLP